MSNSREGMAEVGQDMTATGLTRFNPPRLNTLSYRGAAYQYALERMLARMPIEMGVPGGRKEPPLAHLNVEDDEDWAVALLQAWAVVTDILTFYQERIVNEGYVRTATERRSILELARSIGYELHPGAVASTHLAFTIQNGRGEPARQVIIPAGTAVQGMSPSGELPQVFETSESFPARSEWNILKLANVDQPVTIWPDTNSIRLAVGRVNLQVGNLILIVGDDGVESPAGRRWLMAVLSEVQTEPGKDYTFITWQDAAGSSDPRLPIHNARFFALRELGGLFVYTQAAVDNVSPDRDHLWPAGIGLPQAEVHTLVSNSEGHLFAGTAQDVFRSTDNGASWKPAPTGSLRKNVTALAVDPSGPLYAGTDEGGIYLSQDSGLNWTAMCGETVVQPPKRLKKWLPFLFSAPLPKTTVRSLVIYTRWGKRVLVAGTDDGVFRSTDQGKTWQSSNFDLPGLDWKTGLTKTPVWALAVAKRGWGQHLLAGMESGVFRVKDSPRYWPLLILNLVLVLVLRALSGNGSLIEHLLILVSNVRDRIGLNIELPETLPMLPEFWSVLNTLLIFLIDFLLVAAVITLLFFIIKNIDRFINSRAFRSLGLPVYALAVGANGQLFAGTARGVYRSYGSKPQQHGTWLERLLSGLIIDLLQQLTRDWRLVTRDRTIKDVRSLAVSPAGTILAGTAAGELFRSDEYGEGWYRLDHDSKLADVQAILIMRKDQFAAGTPVTNKSEQRWSLSQVTKNQIDLDQVDLSIAPQQWVVLQQGKDPNNAMLYQVLKTTLANSQDFARIGQFTRLIVDTNNGLAGFDRETTTVWACDEALALYDDRPVSGDAFTLDRVVPGPTPAHRLVFRGTRARVRLVSSDCNLSLHSADGQPPASLSAGELLYLMSPPEPVDHAGEGMVKWFLKNQNGFTGFIEAPSDAFVQTPAMEGDEIVAEVALVKSVDHQNQVTRITLCAPLENIYDHLSLTIYGNVIPATHGRTVQDEVLGSGDGSQANQQLRLRQGPLSFIRAPTVSGVEANLQVQVNGVIWHPVPFLQGVKKDSRVYAVRQDARGNTNIIFGDGERGARLPSGYEQVTATYRIGLGQEANMPSGSLTQLQSAIAGIESVTNPLPATGGVDPENLVRARQNAPFAARTMGRIVSLSDYEDFLNSFVGVGKVQVRWLQAGPQGVLHITVAGTEGQPVPETSELYRMLVQAIEKNRDTTQPTIYLTSYEPVYFNLQARLLIDPDHRARQREIEAAVRTKISQSYSFDAREIGQEVNASRLISLMQDSPSVVAVQLVYLHFSTEEARLASILKVRPDNWREGKPLPAQMLLVNKQKGITLELKVAQ